MKQIIGILVFSGLATTALAQTAPKATTDATTAQGVTVSRTNSEPPVYGSPDNFTGRVQITDRFKGDPLTQISGATVTFEPGARTAWHSHPLGQILIVTRGVGRVQHWGGPIQTIKAGDTVSILPGAKHWHGASPGSAMQHIAISEAKDGKTVDWMEHVSDAQYAQTTHSTER